MLIIIATYNEIDSLPRLVGRLNELLPSAKILVVDDGSPDGTGAWCDQASHQYQNVSVIHRVKKLGLGSATLAGFHFALEHGFELIATMDADFSHDPESLGGLFEALQNCDQRDIGVAIGSRYVAGGQVVGCPLFRKLASRSINLFARTLLRLNTRDNSGAFRVYRRTALQQIDLDQIQSSGYGYLEEILWRLQHAGVKMIELPITFHNREEGQSKASLGTGLSVVWQIVKMAFSRPRSDGT